MGLAKQLGELYSIKNELENKFSKLREREAVFQERERLISLFVDMFLEKQKSSPWYLFCKKRSAGDIEKEIRIRMGQ